jgi:hypothetical protein
MRKNKADVDKPRGCETALSFDDLMSQQIATVSGPRKGESPAPGGVRGFQDGQFGGGRRVGRQADVWSAHGKKIRATTGDFK